MKSKLLSVLVVFALATSLFAGPAAAVEDSTENLPEEAEVGGNVEATFELTQLFGEFEQWTLEGETELQEATWTAKLYDQAGNQIDTQETNSLSADVDIDDGVDHIEVRVVGTTPDIANYSYDPAQSFAAANLTQMASGGSQQAIAGYQIHHYTGESEEARNAIDGASEAVEASSSDSGQALLESAISAYENGNFQNAIDSAQEAEEEASQNRLLRTAAMAVGGLLVLLLIVGGGYRFYRSRKQDPSRLQ